MQRHELTVNKQLIRRESRRRKFLVVMAVVAAALSWLAIHYKLLEVKSVSVEGAREVTAAAVKKIAEIKYIFQTVKWNGELPLEIETTEINKNYWTREVIINVKSREEYGQWCNAGGGECYWFDRTGTAFKPAPSAGGKIIKVVTGPKEVKISEKIISERLFGNLIKIFNVLDGVGMRVGMVEIADESREEAAAYLGKEEVKTYFSLRDEPEGVGRAVEALQGDFGRLEYIDFRSPNRVYYKYK